MKKLASLWSFAFLMLAAVQLLADCAESNKPASIASGSQTPATSSQNTQPIVADPGHGVGQTAMAATTDAPQTNLSFTNGEGTEYRISQQDILQISVFQINDLNSAVQVSQDGNITLPLIGKVQVAGRTTYEAEQSIAGKLRQKYLQSPQVSVSVKTYGKRVTVSGAVMTPRVLADDGNTTLSQAIANAGGVSKIADSTRIHVARSQNQHVQDALYNLDDIQAGKTTDPLLKGGDIVVVEQSGTKVALESVKDLLPFAIFASLI
jgi:polysaccharide export outer membrane protein